MAQHPRCLGQRFDHKHLWHNRGSSMAADEEPVACADVLDNAHPVIGFATFHSIDQQEWIAVGNMFQDLMDIFAPDA